MNNLSLYRTRYLCTVVLIAIINGRLFADLTQAEQFTSALEEPSCVFALSNLGREVLINRAVALIEGTNASDSFRRENFSRISVNTDEERLFVDFSMPIRFFDNDSSFAFWVTVELTAPSITTRTKRGVIAQVIDSETQIDVDFYQPTDVMTDRTYRILARVFPGLTDLSALEFGRGSYIEIREDLLWYSVIDRSPYSYSEYRVWKVGRAVTQRAYEQLEPAPETLREIE